jgi:pyridoxal phosphate-dependent aminotransferase EpsN
MPRILLSVPHMGSREAGFVREAFESNWLSTAGPHIAAFENELEAHVGVAAAAVSSGTAAIHLGLLALGVGPGDDVFCQTLTFVATANPIRYLGANPVFVDSERATWNMDPQLLADALRARAKTNRLPKAVIVVHLFGQCADMDPILEVCGRYGIPVLEDAAEALGATYKGKPAGSLGEVAALSFNGNKIITTTGGGALLSPRRELIEKARFWATQAREPGLAYGHNELGYNYRMSNVLAGIGRGQLRVLQLRVEQRRAIAYRYRYGLADLPGISIMPQAEYGLHTNWLSCFLIDESEFGCSRDALIDALDANGIETRPLWKPMHLQPLFSSSERYGGSVAEDLFRRGICLPSSSSLTLDDQIYVVNRIRRAAGAPPIHSFAGAQFYSTVPAVATPSLVF